MTTSMLDATRQALAEGLPACVQELGIHVMAMEAGQASVAMAAGVRGMRQGGTVSGQALASLADTAMLVAVWSAIGEARPVSTVDLHVSYLRAAASGDVVAHAQVVRRGRTLAFTRVEMSTATTPAQLVATAVATFALGG